MCPPTVNLKIKASEARPGDLLVARLHSGPKGDRVTPIGWRLALAPVSVWNGAYFQTHLMGPEGQLRVVPQDALLNVERPIAARHAAA